MNISNIISLGASQDAPFQILCAAEPLRQFVHGISIIEIIIFSAGLALCAAWLIDTSWGVKALLESTERPNRMPPYLPLIVMFAWFMFTPLALSLANFLMPDLPEWQEAGLGNLVYCLSGITIGAATIFLAKHYFERGLKGFGLNIRTLHKDIPAAILNLLCIWPLVIGTILLTVKLGTMIWGPDFQMAKHDQLELISEHSQWSVRALVFIAAAVVAPVLEELIFRGMFQTIIRSILTTLKYPQSAWLSIGASSALFAAAHADAGHWPALFVLSICMGYSYEKSGSLFRPILIHAMFNGTMVLMTLMS